MMAAALTFSCGKKNKEMTVQDFAKIDIEITTTDQKPETIEQIAGKYGYTLDQYKKFAEKVENDTAIQEELGKIRLGEQKNK
jgi:hypothetical protein